MAQSDTVEATGQTMAIPQKIPVRLTVNGAGVELVIAPWTTLLDALRDRFALTGTKKGCDHGQCGACTVLVDDAKRSGAAEPVGAQELPKRVRGARINACLTLAVMMDGKSITTVEGLASGDRLHALQHAFIEHDAFQCGY